MRSSTARSVAAVASMLAAAACGGDLVVSAVAERCEASDIGGTIQLTIPNPDWNARSRPSDGRLALRIGTVHLDSGEMFDLITSVDADSKRRIYVADSRLHQVAVFDSTGSPIRRLGRQGEGPGEFQGLLTLRVVLGDSLRVFDQRLWRETVYDSAGQLVGTTSPVLGPNYGQFPEVRFDPRGGLLNLGFEKFRESLLEDLGSRISGVVRALNTVSRWDREAKAWEAIRDVPSVEVFFAAGGLRDIPFGRSPLWSPAPDGGFWYADSGEYTLERVGADGRITCRLMVEHKLRPASDTERRDFRTAADVSEASEERIRRIRANRAELPIPERVPALRRLLVGGDGAVWVQPTGEYRGPRLTPERVIWHVYEPDGRPRGRVALPGVFIPNSVVGSLIYGRERDELNVQYASVYEVDL
ncbi:MAG: 6-bladed beta-propeller [Gemmatimonadota bacterium]